MKVLHVALVGSLLVAGIVGCESGSSDEAKREQQRNTMRLGQAESERDQYKMELDNVKATTAAAEARAKAAEDQLKIATESMNKTKMDFDKMHESLLSAQKDAENTQAAKDTLAKQLDEKMQKESAAEAGGKQATQELAALQTKYDALVKQNDELNRKLAAMQMNPTTGPTTQMAPAKRETDMNK